MNSPKAAPATKGRPRDPAKRQALLDAASSLFFAHGFDAVTMDQIVAAARVSRATLWSNFSDKAAIMEAVVARESERMISDNWVRDHPGGDITTDLASFGRALLHFLYDPAVLSFERLLISASRNFPDLTSRFYAAGPGRQFGILTELIRSAQESGQLDIEDIEQAASDLIGLWQGFRQVQTVYGEVPWPSAEELDARAVHGVQLFLRLYATPN